MHCTGGNCRLSSTNERRQYFASIVGGFKAGGGQWGHAPPELGPEQVPARRPLEYKKTSAPDPTVGAYSTPPDPLGGGDEANFPLPKNPTPAIGLLSLWLQPIGPHP